MKNKITNNNPSIIPIFPEAVLYSQQINIDSDRVMKYLKKIKFDITESSIEKESDCFISNKLNIFNDLNFLKKEINKHVGFYLNKLLHYKMDYKFTTSWATKTNNKGYGQKHSHSNCFLSGVYYPIGNTDFKINFYKKHSTMWDVDIKEYNELNAKQVIFEIKNNNTLILFPSELNHSITPNNSDITRYSIAFNVNPKGLIGRNDNGIVF
jgi:uncharacterized protein (TIGR02466 family)